MADSGDTPDSERITYLEQEVKALNKQVGSLTEQVLGSVVILGLPLPRGRRLEIAFRQIENLPSGVLGVIAGRYVRESRMSGLNFDGMMGPLVAALGFERAWKIINIDQPRRTYGDYAVLRWEEMAKSHPCEG